MSVELLGTDSAAAVEVVPPDLELEQPVSTSADAAIAATPILLTFMCSPLLLTVDGFRR